MAAFLREALMIVVIILPVVLGGITSGLRTKKFFPIHPVQIYARVVVKNNSKYKLGCLYVHNAEGGSLSFESQGVAPGTEQTIRFHNLPEKGLCGTLSYEVEGTGRRMVVMYFFPWSVEKYNNEVGAGMSVPGDSLAKFDDRRWRYMYHGDTNNHPSMTGSKRSTSRMEYSDRHTPIKITGTIHKGPDTSLLEQRPFIVIKVDNA